MIYAVIVLVIVMFFMIIFNANLSSKNKKHKLKIKKLEGDNYIHEKLVNRLNDHIRNLNVSLFESTNYNKQIVKNYDDLRIKYNQLNNSNYGDELKSNEISKIPKFNINDILTEINEVGISNISDEKIKFLKKYSNG